jgi:hypothetical protein
MCEVKSKKKQQRANLKKYNGQQQKEMDCDETHLMLNEKMQPI